MKFKGLSTKRGNSAKPQPTTPTNAPNNPDRKSSILIPAHGPGSLNRASSNQPSGYRFGNGSPDINHAGLSTLGLPVSRRMSTASPQAFAPSTFKKKNSLQLNQQGSIIPAPSTNVVEKSRVSIMRDLSTKRDNWNTFVGDPRYKTTFLLKFVDRSTKQIYEKHTLGSSGYSIRCLLIGMWVLKLLFFCQDTLIRVETDGLSQNASQLCLTQEQPVILRNETNSAVPSHCQNIASGQFSLSQAFYASMMLCLSLFGTINKHKFFESINGPLPRKVLIILYPILFSLKLMQGVSNALNQNHVGAQYLSAMIFYLPILAIGTLALSDWPEFLLACFAHYCLATLFYTTHLPLKAPLFQVLFIYAFFFACIEKWRKEQFIIGHTNAKTKKMLFSLLNQTPSPIAIVSTAKTTAGSANAAGQILYCNTQFEKMIQERLGMGSVPQSIFRLTKDDEESTNRLKQVFQNPYPVKTTSPLTLNRQPSFRVSQSSEAPLKENPSKIEIKLTKVKHANNLDSARKRDLSPALSSIKEETKSNYSTTNSHHRIQTLKEIFDAFEIATVQAEQVTYQNTSKAVMLTFNLVSEHKARKQLLYVNSQTLYKQILNFNKRLQVLYSQSKNADDTNFLGGQNHQESLIEFLGTTYLAMNKIQQIAHEFQDDNINISQSDQKNKSPVVTQPLQEDTFLLKEELMQCIESLSAKCLNQSASIKLDTKCLPERLSGDLQRFRLSIHCVTEFAMTYCREGVIDIVVNFVGMSTSNQYMISFDFSFNRNRQFNEEPLIKLLNSLQASSGCLRSKTEELLLQNYDEFFGLIQYFGMGMVIFPNLISEMKGTFNIQKLGLSDAIDSSFDAKSINSGASPKLPSRGDQDSAPAQLVIPESPNLNLGQLKISFKLNFNHAEMSKKVMNPYFPFNPNREDTNGKQIFKSPLLKTRENRNKVISDMRRIMEEQKMPSRRLMGASTSSIGGSNFAQLVHAEQALKTQQSIQGQGNGNSHMSHDNPVPRINNRLENVPQILISSSQNSNNLLQIPLQSQKNAQSSAAEISLVNVAKHIKSNNLLSSSTDDQAAQRDQMMKDLDQHPDSSRGSLSDKALLLNLAAVNNEGSAATGGSYNGGDISAKTFHINKQFYEGNMTQKPTKNRGNQVKQVLRDFEKNYGGMNKQEFFKNNKRLSQGGLGSGESPINSEDPTFSQIRKNEDNSDNSMSVNSRSASNQRLLINKQLSNDPLKNFNDSTRAVGSGEINTVHPSLEFSAKEPGRINTQALTENGSSNNMSSNDLAAGAAKFIKSQSGFIERVPMSSDELNAGSLTRKIRKSPKQISKTNSSVRRTSLFHKKSKIKGTTDNKQLAPKRGVSQNQKNTLGDDLIQSKFNLNKKSDNEAGVNSQEEIKDVDDSFCTSTSLKSQDMNGGQKQTIKRPLEEKKKSQPISGELSKVRSQLENLGINVGMGTFNEIEDGSFAMRRRSILQNAHTIGMQAGISGGTPSLKGTDMVQNNMEHISSGEQIREILSFGKIQDQIANKMISNEQRQSASFSIGSMVPPLKNYIVNRDSDIFTMFNNNPSSNNSPKQPVTGEKSFTQMLGETSKIHYQSSLSDESSFLSNQVRGSSDEEPDICTQLDFMIEDDVGSTALHNTRLNTQPLSKSVFRKWAFENTKTSGLGASKNILKPFGVEYNGQQTQRVMGVTSRPRLVEPSELMVPLPMPVSVSSRGDKGSDRLKGHSQQSFNIRGGVSNTFAEVESANGLLNRFGWGLADRNSELQVPESTDRVFGRSSQEQDTSLDYQALVGQKLTKDQQDFYNTAPNKKPTISVSRLQTHSIGYGTNSDPRNQNPQPMGMPRPGFAQADQVVNQAYESIPQTSRDTISTISRANLHILGSNQGLQSREDPVKSGFPYKMGQKTKQYMQKLQQIDAQQGGDDLMFWDKQLQDEIAQRQKDKVESMASYVNQVQMFGMQSTLAHFMFSAPTIDTNKRYVLVVEDNNMICEILIHTFRELGYEAITADNGKVAVDKFTGFMREGVLFDLILMDIIMPLMGGYEATQLIRKLETEFSLTDQEKHFICGFSAQMNKDIEKKCHDCGMNTIIQKPVEPPRLKQMLEENQRSSNIILRDSNTGSKNFDMTQAQLQGNQSGKLPTRGSHRLGGGRGLSSNPANTDSTLTLIADLGFGGGSQQPGQGSSNNLERQQTLLPVPQRDPYASSYARKSAFSVMRNSPSNANQSHQMSTFKR
ncbi:hypothetical protein FGO68_gene5455 [Halteria grandinella]|uniref:Response regulatory domain-containing protein n=1 Tax=Halteria grandinella TaxID=5974 RepID=A0A8J8P8I3_HALGN|nr:hypothetical protein FGO68_gene5455 [Halteria grandinella]